MKKGSLETRIVRIIRLAAVVGFAVGWGFGATQAREAADTASAKVGDELTAPPEHAESVGKGSEVSEKADENPIDKLRAAIDLIWSPDKAVLEQAPRAAGETAEDERDAQLAALERSNEAFEAMKSLSRSGRLETYLATGVAEPMEEAGQGSALRGAVRLNCAAARIETASGDIEAAISFLRTATRLADAPWASRGMSWQLVRGACLSLVLAEAQEILLKVPGGQEARTFVQYDLSQAFVGRKLTAGLASAWNDADDYRDFALYSSLAPGLVRDWEETTSPDDTEVDSADANERSPASADLDAALENFRSDLAAAVRLRERILSETSWPYYTLPKDDFWKDLLAGNAVSRNLPYAYIRQQYVLTMLRMGNVSLARFGLLSILVEVRRFESDKARLPESLAEVAVFAGDSGDAETFAEAPPLDYLDPYTGKPCLYVLEKDGEGRPSGFKIYSVGWDLEDNDGKERRQGEQGGSDIVIEGKALVGAR